MPEQGPFPEEHSTASVSLGQEGRFIAQPNSISTQRPQTGGGEAGDPA